MKTNSKSVRELIRSHILACVTDYNGNTFPIFNDARAHLKLEFARVADYPHNRRCLPNNQERFHDYLMGIPFDFEFAPRKIAEFLADLDVNPSGKKYDAEKSARLYTYLIFKEIA
jgi:hypothetical protein